MLAAPTYRFDIQNDTAILSIGSTLDQAALAAILGRCRELEPHIVTLQLDLRPLGAISDAETSAIRLILHTWRQARGGSFRLTTTHLVATCQQVAAAPEPAWGALNVPRATWRMRDARALSAVRGG
jgi:hypothetical protein